VRWPALLGLGLALLTFAVFSSVLPNDFVAWDDGKNIYENPHLGLGWESLRWIFTNYDYVHRYLPLGWLSYSVDRALFGGGPLSYHAGNLVLHVLNTLLVFGLIRRLLARATHTQLAEGNLRIEAASALGALAWAVHPLRVEAVAWASSRIYGVATALLLLGLLSYLRACRDEGSARRPWLWLAGLCYGLSLFTYPIGLSGVVVFVVLDFYPLRRLPMAPTRWLEPACRRVWLEQGVFLIPGLSMLAVTIWARVSNPMLGPVFESGHVGLADRVMQAFYVWAYYLWRPWWPFNLAPEYATLLEFDPWSAPFILSCLLVLGVTGLLIARHRAWPGLLAIWACHLALLVPVMGLESFRHYHTGDRYSYIEGMGWALVLAGALWAVWERERWRHILGGALLLWVGLCTALVPAQTAIWKDSITLHSRIVMSLSSAQDRALQDRAMHETFLGDLLLSQTNLAAAESCFRHAIQLAPKNSSARLRLANVLALQSRTAEAEASYQELLRANPSEVRGRIYLAILLGNAGRPEESARYLQEALRLAPQDCDAHHNLGVTLERLGRTNDAQIHYARARELRAEPSQRPAI
jgi:protein O-mannosyl-transferase